MRYRVTFHPDAEQDLENLSDYVAARSGLAAARNLMTAIIDHCLGLSQFPVRGTERSDLAPGLRLLGYRRIATIAYRIRGPNVEILRIAYRGRDTESLFTQ